MAISTNSLIVMTIISFATSQEYTANNHTLISHEARLIDDLLGRAASKGQQMARPVRDVNDRVLLNYGLSLVQILDMDEINQNILLNVWETQEWYDEFHTWDPADYGGLSRVNLPPNDILWKPDIVLYQNVETKKTDRREVKLLLFHDGRVLWIPQGIYRSTCATDMTNFPFDSQKCVLKFGSWSYHRNQLDMGFYANKTFIGRDQYIPNVEWTLVGSSAVHNAPEYDCCPNESYVDLTFTLHIRRQWRFYFHFLLLPALILSAMSTTIFWIPPTRPDRTGLGTSLMGSFMLLLILVTQVSPPCEIRFVMYICANMVLLGLSTLFSCSMVNLSLRTTPMHSTTRKILLGPLATFFQVSPLSRTQTDARVQHIPNVDLAGDTHKYTNEYGSPLEHTKSLLDQKGSQGDHTNVHQGHKAADQGHKNTHIGHKEASEVYKAEWQITVKVLDRLSFLLYLITLAVLLALFFPRPMW